MMRIPIIHTLHQYMGVEIKKDVRIPYILVGNLKARDHL
jgi:hypothetical protein